MVKTVKFEAPKYVGDPINAVRIFNEKQVDELMVIDIDASALKKEPNYAMITTLASECRMPLCYGGGVRTAEQIQRIVASGVEKVAISAAAVESLALVSEAAEQVGRQSIVGVIDVRKKGSRYEVFTHNGKKATGLEAVAWAKQLERAGVGEIVINSIDQDGTMLGYDLELVGLVRAATTRPLTVIGGAGTLAHVQELMTKFGSIGSAAGSLFVFKGKFRAVLISYPSHTEKDALIAAALKSRDANAGTQV